ncbi:MAG: deoxyguanosinetriphosphate triphosphohydrolase [Micrococcaceae bacterium]
MTDYTDADRTRWVSEVHHTQHRSEFQRDRARILHSSALRRLGAKTQVVTAGSDDFVRTRLTHSLEVAQLGRELAAFLGCDQDVVDSACLAHDLGHPPFGHNGETALNEVSKDIGGFEGNAQTMRLLVRLEPKSYTKTGKAAGLNLTRATLDATCKYPWLLKDAPIKNGKQTHKFGIYEDDIEVFEWLRAGRQDQKTPIEAQVMDLSDDIAYSVHDVEDAVTAGKINLTKLDDPENRANIIRYTQEWYLPNASDEQLEMALANLEDKSYWAKVTSNENGLTHNNATKLKNMTSQLIGHFTQAALLATRSEYGPGNLTRYNAELIVPPNIVDEIAVLKGITTSFVMVKEESKPVYKEQRKILQDLVKVLLETEAQHLEQQFKESYRVAQDEKQAKRVIIDQVASLTDWSATNLHKKLCS